MRVSYLKMAICVLALGAVTIEHPAMAMTTHTGARHAAADVADTPMQTGNDGIRIWMRLSELGRQEGFSGLALTLFAPSDAAFMMMPDADLSKLLAPDQRDLRRGFLARATTTARITPQQIAGRRVSITTLDGRPLTLDATGGELMVGEAEAIDVQTLPDARVIYILDLPTMD